MGVVFIGEFFGIGVVDDDVVERFAKDWGGDWGCEGGFCE